MSDLSRSAGGSHEIHPGTACCGSRHAIFVLRQQAGAPPFHGPARWIMLDTT